MSADLLRRAAVKLRELTEGVPAYFAPPWFQVFTDSESLTGVRRCDEHEPAPADLTEDQWLHWACPYCEHVETYSEGLSAYVTALHPPVALALADWLDHEADRFDRVVGGWLQQPASIQSQLGAPIDRLAAETFSASLAVARAVLREEEP